MKQIIYKIITPKNLKKYQDSLLDLLDSAKKRPEKILKSLKNTDYIILALDGEKIVGSNQIITDKYFVALFVNLFVHPEYRKDGIGGKTIEKSITQVRKLAVQNIKLIPDSSSPWLNGFYAKYGFKEGIYMGMK